MRYQVKTLLLICFLFATKAWAKSHVLIISGDTKESRFKKNAELVAKRAKEEGREVYIAAGTGKEFRFADARNIFSAVLSEDVDKISELSAPIFEQSLKTIGSRMKEGDSLILMIVGHGFWPRSEKEVDTGGISMANLKSVVDGKEVTKHTYLFYSSLKRMIKEHIPSHNRVKIINQLCFSGGVHTISSSLTNTCSSSITDYRSIGWTSKNQTSLFTEGFWSRLHTFFDFNKDGKFSFFERHWQGIYFDFFNEDRGVLSSEAFLNNKLGLEAHDLTKHGNFKAEYGYDEEISTGGIRTSYSPDQFINCSLDGFSLLYIEGLSNIEFFLKNNLNYEIGHLTEVPDEIKEAIAYSKGYWSKENSLVKEKKYSHEFLSLKKRWNNLSFKQKNQRRALFKKKFEELNKKSKISRDKFLFFYKMAQYGKKINMFLASNPSEKDKETLWRLMKCEVEAL